MRYNVCLYAILASQCYSLHLHNYACLLTAWMLLSVTENSLINCVKSSSKSDNLYKHYL